MISLLSLLLLGIVPQDPPKPEDKPPAKQDEPPKPAPVQNELSAAAKEAQESLKKIEARIPEFRTFHQKLEEIKNQFLAARMSGQKEKADQLMAEYDAVSKKAEAFKQELIKNLQDVAAKAGEEFKKTPKDADLLDVKINVHMMLGETDKAVVDARALFELLPAKTDHLVRFLRLLYVCNLYDEAVKVSESILAREKDHIEAQLVRGMCLFALDRFEEAAKKLEELQKSAAKKTPEESGTAEEFLRASKDNIVPYQKEVELRAIEKKADDLPRIKLTTSRGVILVELFENEAPNTVANFISLVEKKFYDGTKFHRVVPNFMIQGGDPNSKDEDPANDGRGGPGYLFDDEMPEGKFRRHFRGTLSMAHMGPNTNGSQFFITHMPSHWLNGAHTVFGRVLEGQEVVDSIRAGDLLTSAQVVRKRAHEYKPVVKEEPKPPVVPPPPPPKDEPKKEEPPKDPPQKDEPKKDDPPKSDPPK